MRGIYCSNTGLNALQQKMDVTANNVANSTTDGFKESQLSVKTFKDEINGVQADQLKTNFAQGTLRETGDPNNFGIIGDAFFKLNTSGETVYTRAGTFKMDAEGYLISDQGFKVAGASGDVKMVEGKPDQEFALASFAHKEYLTPVEGGFAANEQCGLGEAGNVSVKQGCLEASNVDLARNLVDMITVSRAYALNSRMITAQDEMLKKAVDEVGVLKK